MLTSPEKGDLPEVGRNNGLVLTAYEARERWMWLIRSSTCIIRSTTYSNDRVSLTRKLAGRRLTFSTWKLRARECNSGSKRLGTEQHRAARARSTLFYRVQAAYSHQIMSEQQTSTIFCRRRHTLFCLLGQPSR